MAVCQLTAACLLNDNKEVGEKPDHGGEKVMKRIS